MNVSSNGLQVMVPDLENPYREQVTHWLSQEFPANLDKAANVLEAVMTAILSTGKVRFGPTPGPESLVVLRRIVAESIAKGQPIPMLVPWGSKKPVNSSGVDVAELGGLKTLSCLQKRVIANYAPGLRINLRVEDVGGFYLFADEGEVGRRANQAYTDDFVKLIRILGLDFITIKLESQMTDEATYVRTAERIRPTLTQFMMDTDAHGFEGYAELDSWKELQRLGWKGIIPKEMRDYYRERYARTYPGIDLRKQTDKLATYLAGSLARYELKATGAEESWGRNFIQLNFAPPSPGTPAAIGDNRMYYRTLPENMARTHLPPWRARGYLKINGSNVTPKLASWSESLELSPSIVRLSRNGESVDVRADQLIED